MKKNFDPSIITIFACIFVGIVGFINVFYEFSRQKSSDNKTKILISQVIEHPALNKTTQGIIDALTQAGYIAKKNTEIHIESAQANNALAAQIASKYAFQKSDIVIGVGTMSAQSFTKYAIQNQVKLVFSSITDPISASLVQSLDAPLNNTSGVSNFVPLEPQLALFKQLQPTLERIGILYNPGELNSVNIVQKLKEIAPQFALTIIEQTINKTADVSQNTLRLAHKVDALFISNDNTALSALPTILKIANDTQIPVYVSDTDAVPLGALAALGPNQYEIGQQTGRMIVRILQGADINTQKVEFPETMDLYLNLDAAKNLDITIPPNILHKATHVISSLPS